MQEIRSEIDRVFALQYSHYPRLKAATPRERVAKLKLLLSAILDHRKQIEDALFLDLRKPVHEVGLTELYEVISEIKHACRLLPSWMKAARVKNPAVFFGAKAWIRMEPRGVVLIISPWNYPFQLALGPLVSAIAAGNCVILKPSEISEHTSGLIRNLISSIFPENEVAVFEGDHTISAALLEKPFHHVHFTGSSAVGKVVMHAASRHLTSVTLEMGGKSPVIVDENFDMNEAARKIIWGKCLNAGQTCVAPDYVLIPQESESHFVECAKEAITKLYSDPERNPDYCKIISAQHQQRLKALIDEAVQEGARIETGGTIDDARLYISPTILSGIHPDSRILQEEIFGPVLPVIPYRTLDEALAFINSRERPLSLYIFSKNQVLISRILENTDSGGCCINDVAVQYAHLNLPFGGINHSGIGNSHGEFGFRSFSYQRAVLAQPQHGAITFFYPPYTDRMKKLIDLTIKYF